MNTTKANVIQKCLPILLALALAILSCEKSAKLERHLSKEEAKQILEAMGYKNVVIGAVVHSFSRWGFGGDNTAFAIAIGTPPPASVLKDEIETMFAFDEQLGWFAWEHKRDEKTGKLQLNIFTQNGKQTLKK